MKRTPMTRSTPLRRSTGEARAEVPVLRLRKCKAPGCGQKFRPARPLQVACSADCAYSVGMRVRLKQDKAKDKERRAALETQPQWIAKAQAAFNAFIRARDVGKPCICCGQFPQSYSARGGDWDAGHFRSRGAAPELRFDERNCHAQLKRCNRRAWDVSSYRANLIERIGLAEVEALEGLHQPRKWTVADLKALAAHYRAKARALLKEQG